MSYYNDCEIYNVINNIVDNCVQIDLLGTNLKLCNEICIINLNIALSTCYDYFLQIDLIDKINNFILECVKLKSGS